MKKKIDMVNSPPHYLKGGLECIDVIRAALDEKEFRGYCKGNSYKFELPDGVLEDDFNQIWNRLEQAKKEGNLDEDDKL